MLLHSNDGVNNSMVGDADHDIAGAKQFIELGEEEFDKWRSNQDYIYVCTFCLFTYHDVRQSSVCRGIWYQV